jgi:hypothetical protein
MEPNSDSSEVPRPGSSFRAVFPWVCGGLILLALAVGPIRRSASSHPNSTTRPGIFLRMDTNSVLSFHGISLANPAFRHVVFKTLHVLNQRVGVFEPPITPSVRSTNCLNALIEINKAGLFQKRE